MIKTIGSFYITRLTLGAHNNFHTSFAALLTPSLIKSLHLENIVTEYSKAITLENCVVTRKTKFAATLEMKESNERRNRLISAINRTISASIANPIMEKQTAANTLKLALASYKGIVEHEYTRKTSEIEHMLTRLSSETLSAHLATLALTQEVSALAQANDEFESAFTNKLKEVKERTHQMETDTLKTRRALDALYARLVQIINAYALTQPTEEIEKLVASANGLVMVYKNIVANQAKGQRERNEELGEGMENWRRE